MISKEKNRSGDSLDHLIKCNNVSFYGYRGEKLPKLLLNKQWGQLNIFSKNEQNKSLAQNAPSYKIYKDVSEINLNATDVCFLDGEAVRSLFVKFPLRSKYVLVRLGLHKGWILGLPGLLRRIIKKQVKIDGVARFEAGAKTQRWLVLKLPNFDLRFGLSLSKDVGSRGLFDYLRKEKVDYVVLRFFEKLPNLYRDGGDLDILVSDSGFDRMADFLEEHPGQIKIDAWPVSGLRYRRGMTYYPPPLARKILESAVDGPAGSRIPAPKEFFLSFAYHALYHKGEEAGVPSSIPGVKFDKHPKNDYVGILKNAARKLGINIDINMEALDNYLYREGWRPLVDTMAKISVHNRWALKRFFSKRSVKELGLGVFILRGRALQLNLSDSIVAAIKKEGFLIVKRKRFNEQEQKRASRFLRGGDWLDGYVTGEKELFFPKEAVVVMDLYFLHAAGRGINLGNYNRLKFLKEKIRTKLDQDTVGLLHSTDNTDEAWEYIKVCFPQEHKSIKQDVDKIYSEFRPSLSEKIRLYFKTAVYYKTNLVKKIKDSIVDYFTK